MARSKGSKIELTAYDDLFETDESRAEANLSKIREIPIVEIDEFPDHPFKVLMDEDMEQLVDSVRRSGVMTPATVRQKEDGRYELISGHRRKKACELAGLETLKCEVKELTRDEAIIVMVESNLQRTTILPSEKAFAYKMRLEAMNRQVLGAKIMSEITYTKQADYLIPDLTLPTEPELPLGRYALMHRDYLENHKRVAYLNLLTSGMLNAHLHQTEQAALQRLELLTKQLAKEQGVTEELKEKAPMQWLGMMNNIRSQAEEVILEELIFS